MYWQTLVELSPPTLQPDVQTDHQCHIPLLSWAQWMNIEAELMAYSHCTEIGLRQVQGMGSGAMSSNILYRNVHIGLRQGKEPGPIVSYCAVPVPYTCRVPVWCE